MDQVYEMPDESKRGVQVINGEERPSKTTYRTFDITELNGVKILPSKALKIIQGDNVVILERCNLETLENHIRYHGHFGA